jgi:hypothetical protein
MDMPDASMSMTVFLYPSASCEYFGVCRKPRQPHRPMTPARWASCCREPLSLSVLEREEAIVVR